MAWTNAFANLQIENISAFTFYDDDITASYLFPEAAIQNAAISLMKSGLETIALGGEMKTADQVKLEINFYFDDLSDADIAKLYAEQDIRDNAGNYFHLVYECGAVARDVDFFNAIATIKRTVTLNGLIIYNWSVEAEVYDYTQLVELAEE